MPMISTCELILTPKGTSSGFTSELGIYSEARSTSSESVISPRIKAYFKKDSNLCGDCWEKNGRSGMDKSSTLRMEFREKDSERRMKWRTILSSDTL